MSKFLTGLWMVKKMIHDPIGDYSLSPRRSPDSSCLLPPGLRVPDRAEPKKRYRGAEGDLLECGGWYELDCEDDARDRRGVNPDGHPGSPLPAPLQDRLRQPEARDQEVRLSPPVRERELQLHLHRRGAGVRQEDVSPPAVADGGQVQGDLHGRREALLHADLVAQCSVMPLRQLVLHLASLPNPTHAPV